MFVISSSNVTLLYFIICKYDFYLSHCCSIILTVPISLLDRCTPAHLNSYSSIKRSFFLHHHLISSLTQYHPSEYPECRLLVLNINNYLYLSPSGDLDFFQYLLVAHPVLPDKYSHRKYLLHCSFCIHITHLCFFPFVLFGVGPLPVGDPLLPNQHQGK